MPPLPSTPTPLTTPKTLTIPKRTTTSTALKLLEFLVNGEKRKALELLE